MVDYINPALPIIRNIPPFSHGPSRVLSLKVMQDLYYIINSRSLGILLKTTRTSIPPLEILWGLQGFEDSEFRVQGLGFRV